MTYQDASFAALGDPTRRQILLLLRNGPAPVGTIAGRFPVSRPAISQHLKVLKDARLVVVRPAGTRRLYELDPRGLAALRTFFEQFWTDALQAFKAEVERPTKARRRRTP